MTQHNSKEISVFGTAPDSPARDLIARELDTVRTKRGDLLAPGTRRQWEVIILSCCILINGIYLIFRPDYFTLFIAASFYLNMGYFITLLIPTSAGGGQVSMPEIAKFQGWLKENGVRTSTTRFTRIFINSFLINSRGLSLGIGLLFAVDILMVLIDYLEGLPLHTTAIIIGQSLFFIVFYFLVWRTEPFTSRFSQNLDKVRNRLAQDLPAWLISIMFLVGFLLVVLVFLTTIILLPGMTLDAFVTQSGLTDIAHRFGLILILIVSQYFIIRAIHGITSRAMANRLLDHREAALDELLDEASRDENNAAGRDPAEEYETTSALLESRIYLIKRNTLLGTFPVFVVDLDFSVLLDTTTKMVITGHIRKD
ncbi:MAG: hypothetical protein CVV32_07080 [Methanomicrobiales archaeon HGW-Methanomicrobiales-3]|jgi:hypothetical protein|nr:MAG: hypothetical protein CVV32_07080 [Methanomicrobiales archaeon HGW-Methanomicrobiales-3]